MSVREPSPQDAVDSTNSVVWTSLPAAGNGAAGEAVMELNGDEQAAVLPVVESHPTPEFIRDFEICEELGRGAFGTVYRALDRGHEGREVAIKVFGGRMTTEESQLRFRREVEIAARLDHPNISSISAYGTHNEAPYIVMRLIRGQTLQGKVARDGPMPPGESARVVSRLAIAIEHAHSRNVIHRDLKPSNVILEEGEPVVVDLGLSKSLMAAESFTGKGDLLGSPLFMAPEQLFGERADVRSDVFGLGGLLYYLLTGLTPRSLEDFRKRATPEVRLPREIPSGLAAICEKALAFEPEKRFRTAAELADTLGHWMSGRQLGLSPRALSPSLLLFSITLLCALVGLILYGFWEQNEESVVFQRNSVNDYSVGETHVVIKDGRVVLNDHEVFFPNLKIILRNTDETWSPPAQELVSDEQYLIGESLSGFLLARISYLSGSMPITGKVRFELVKNWTVQCRDLKLILKRSEDGIYRGRRSYQGLVIKLSGALEASDGEGLSWGFRRHQQLVARLDGRPTWSPPRPNNRTNFGFEYPLGLMGRRLVMARFQKQREGKESVTVILRIVRIETPGPGEDEQ